MEGTGNDRPRRLSFAQNALFIALFNDHELIIKRHQMSLFAME